MNILAIETTGPLASVALINEKQQIWEEHSQRKLSHLQNLIPMVANLLEKCELQIGDVTHIAVSEGPGSFTGIRIGVATAKALAQALDLQVIAVPTLKSFAWNVPDFDGLFCPIFDARREQVYAAAYYWKDGVCLQGVKDGAYGIGEFLALVEAFDFNHEIRIMMLGDGTNIYSDVVEAWKLSTNRISPKGDSLVILAEDKVKFQQASSIARLAYSLYEEGKAKPFFDLRPVYLRKAEAQRKLEEKQLKETIK